MPTIQIDPNELSNERALVTGGTKNMGEEIVKRLGQAGAKVITAARSKPDELRWRSLSFGESPDLFIQSDISTPDGTAQLSLMRDNCYQEDRCITYSGW